MLLTDWVQRNAEQWPDSPVLMVEGLAYTHADLERTANQLAHALQDRGVRAGDRVALLMGRGWDALCAMVGVMKAGAIYAPIELENPLPRLQKILTNAKPAFVLAAGPSAAKMIAETDVWKPAALAWLDSQTPPPRDNLAFDREGLQAFPVKPPALKAQPSDACQMLFTSGSTGTPKGVLLTHENVRSHIDWTVQHFEVSREDRFGWCTPLSFDTTSADVFTTLAAGACLCPFPHSLGLSAGAIVQFVEKAGITQWHTVPLQLQFLARSDALRPGAFPTLRHLMVGGEALPVTTLRYWMDRLPHVTFTNLYGPTETAMCSTSYTAPRPLPEDMEQMPIGRPCPGEEILLLDTDGNPLNGPGPGEIAIAGSGVSLGYFNNAEKTAAAFVPDPRHPGKRIYRTGDLAEWRDDRLFFRGRLDNQVKSHGYRVELGEVEAALAALPALVEAAVYASGTRQNGAVTLCCAYVARSGEKVTGRSLRRALKEKLPDYMIPEKWTALKALPRKPNGKLDRLALQEIAESSRQ